MPDNYNAQPIYFVDPATKGPYAGAPVFAVDPSTGTPEQKHPGVLPGKFYPTFNGTFTTASAVSAVDFLFLYPFWLPTPLTLANLSVRTVTGGLGSSMKMGLWANQNGRPIGAPIVADNTGQATATSGVTITVPLTASLAPQFYWLGSKFTGTLPALVAISTGAFGHGMNLSRSTLGPSAFSGVQIGDAYANPLPTFTGAESFTETGGAGIPIIFLGT